MCVRVYVCVCAGVFVWVRVYACEGGCMFCMAMQSTGVRGQGRVLLICLCVCRLVFPGRLTTTCSCAVLQRPTLPTRLVLHDECPPRTMGAVAAASTTSQEPPCTACHCEPQPPKSQTHGQHSMSTLCFDRHVTYGSIHCITITTDASHSVHLQGRLTPCVCVRFVPWLHPLHHHYHHHHHHHHVCVYTLFHGSIHCIITTTTITTIAFFPIPLQGWPAPCVCGCDHGRPTVYVRGRAQDAL